MVGEWNGSRGKFFSVLKQQGDELRHDKDIITMGKH